MASRYVWDRVWVNGLALGGSTVYWYLDYRFNGTEPWEFDVEWSAQQNGPWEQINAEAITSNFYQDQERHRYGTGIESYYRVKLTDGDGNVYYSSIESEAGKWNRHEYLTAKEIVRKEYLLQNKHTGRYGYLHKRLVVGLPCTSCLDHDTQQVTNSSCSVCYGTGLIGGYAEPIPCWITADNKQVTTVRPETQDQVEPIVLRGRAVGFPDMHVGDFWRDVNTDERFFIRNVSDIVCIRGKALISGVELRQVPTTDIIYSINTSGDSSNG